MLISAYPWIRSKEALSLRVLQLLLVVQPTSPVGLALQSWRKGCLDLHSAPRNNPTPFAQMKIFPSSLLQVLLILSLCREQFLIFLQHLFGNILFLKQRGWAQSSPGLTASSTLSNIFSA